MPRKKLTDRGNDGGSKDNMSKPGKTNNPKGRPPLPEGFREACALKTWEHFGVLSEIIKTSKNEAARLKAWELLAIRGYGHPKQEMDITSKGEQVYQPVVYAQPPSQTPEEWMERWAPKPDPEKLN